MPSVFVDCYRRYWLSVQKSKVLINKIRKKFLFSNCFFSYFQFLKTPLYFLRLKTFEKPKPFYRYSILTPAILKSRVKNPQIYESFLLSIIEGCFSLIGIRYLLSIFEGSNPAKYDTLFNSDDGYTRCLLLRVYV